MNFDADFTPISMGFDPRCHDDIAVELPQGAHLRVRYLEGKAIRVVEGTPEKIAKRLRDAGYIVA